MELINEFASKSPWVCFELASSRKLFIRYSFTEDLPSLLKIESDVYELINARTPSGDIGQALVSLRDHPMEQSDPPYYISLSSVSFISTLSSESRLSTLLTEKETGIVQAKAPGIILL
jgi:hypothetical protein